MGTLRRSGTPCLRTAAQTTRNRNEVVRPTMRACGAYKRTQEHAGGLRDSAVRERDLRFRVLRTSRRELCRLAMELALSSSL